MWSTSCFMIIISHGVEKEIFYSHNERNIHERVITKGWQWMISHLEKKTGEVFAKSFLKEFLKEIWKELKLDGV